MKPKNTSALLLFLVFLDIALFVAALLAPTVWFKVLHGTDLNDPTGFVRALLARTGGVWVAFTLLQFIAWWRWEKTPYWLVVIAGVRWTELFSDWIFFYTAPQLSWFGKAGFVVSPVANLVFGILLMKAYFQQIKEPVNQTH